MRIGHTQRVVAYPTHFRCHQSYQAPHGRFATIDHQKRFHAQPPPRGMRQTSMFISCAPPRGTSLIGLSRSIGWPWRPDCLTTPRCACLAGKRLYLPCPAWRMGCRFSWHEIPGAPSRQHLPHMGTGCACSWAMDAGAIGATRSAYSTLAQWMPLFPAFSSMALRLTAF